MTHYSLDTKSCKELGTLLAKFDYCVVTQCARHPFEGMYLDIPSTDLTSFRAISNSISSVTFLPNKLSNHLPPIIAVKIVRSPCGKLHELKTTPSNGEFSEEDTRNPKASWLNFCPVHSKFTSPTVTHSMDVRILARSGCAFFLLNWPHHDTAVFSKF